MASSLIFLFTFSVLADSNGVLGRRGFERRLQLHNHASKGIKFGSSGGPDINFGSGSASPIKLRNVKQLSCKTRFQNLSPPCYTFS